MVPASSKAAIAAGADGLMIEVHPDPTKALSDGPQSLTPSSFKTLCKELQPFIHLMGRDSLFMNKIGIIGLGLIGGSIAKALKYNDPNVFIVAMDFHTESLQQALNEKVIDHYTTTLDSSFSSCHIIFFCTPVQKMMDLVPSLLPFISSQCIITDVGSTKKAVMECMKQYQDRICFIGGHPMAGSEKTGYAASKHYLFQNAYYILTPFPFTPLINSKIDGCHFFSWRLTYYNRTHTSRFYYSLY